MNLLDSQRRACGLVGARSEDCSYSSCRPDDTAIHDAEGVETAASAIRLLSAAHPAASSSTTGSCSTLPDVLPGDGTLLPITGLIDEDGDETGRLRRSA
jgi:hypothetical protein